MATIGQDIDYACQLLREGKLVAIPTETVYGLAGNGLDEEAVAAIFDAKNRPSFDPMILHTSALEKVQPLIYPIPKKLQILANHFMPGPLSILVRKRDSIPDIVTAGSPKVAIRIPSHPLTLTLLSKLDFPLAAPSANPFGYISPTIPDHVYQQLGDKISYILDGGPCKVGLESTIVDETDGVVTILRKGGVPVEEIEKWVGKVKVKERSSSNPQAPGMLDSHYSPTVPLVIADLSEVMKKYDPQRIGYLSFRELSPDLPKNHQFVLSRSGDLQEAAYHLFSFMRQLDELDLDIIVAQLLPEEGLGRAINDKLRRASQKTHP